MTLGPFGHRWTRALAAVALLATGSCRTTTTDGAAVLASVVPTAPPPPVVADAPPPPLPCASGELTPFSLGPAGVLPPDSAVTFPDPAETTLRPLDTKIVRLDVCFDDAAAAATLQRIVVRSMKLAQGVLKPRYLVLTPGPGDQVEGLAAALFGDPAGLVLVIRTAANQSPQDGDLHVVNAVQVKGWHPAGGPGFVTYSDGELLPSGVYNPFDAGGNKQAFVAQLVAADLIAASDSTCGTGALLVSTTFHAGTLTLASDACKTTDIAGNKYAFKKLVVTDTNAALPAAARQPRTLAAPAELALFTYVHTHHNEHDGWQLRLAAAAYGFETTDEVATVGGVPVSVKLLHVSYGGVAQPDRRLLSLQCTPLSCAGD